MKKSRSQYRHERVLSPKTLKARGKSKYRSKITPTGKVLRFAFPPGRRRKGAGELQAILHPNPPGPVTTRGATLIYSRLLEIRASKAGMRHRCDPACKASGHRYKHVFKKNFLIWGLADGSLLIK